MAKTFITERDIEDMARRGELSLTVHDDVVLTELAFEKAQKLGWFCCSRMSFHRRLPSGLTFRNLFTKPVHAFVASQPRPPRWKKICGSVSTTR